MYVCVCENDNKIIRTRKILKIKKVNIFRFSTFTSKQSTYIKDHHFKPENHIGSTFINCNMCNLLKDEKVQRS